MQKKLYKDSSTKMLCGVLSGIAQYFNIDATIVRVAYVLLSFFSASFPGVIAYIILAAIMPDKSQIGHDDYTVE
ncbi:MAG: PspC domain-containing protein [Anaerofustis stercorihominis]|nr:PspC domain-containing protein [Anaerofustis stercorihominis]